MSSEKTEMMAHQRIMLHADYTRKEHELKMENPQQELTYPNQQEAAATILHAFFVLKKLVVTLIAEMGAGKTGTFLRTAYNMCTFPEDNVNIIYYKNVFIITGMSDVDWQNQTAANMLESFKAQVFHRGRFAQFRRLVENGISNALIIIDECHIGADKDHSMAKLLHTVGILNIETLRKNNIKILEVSATPGHTLNDSLKWGNEYHQTVVLQPGPRYIGLKKMRDQGRLRQPLALENVSEVENLCKLIEERWGPQDPRWHAVRIARKGKKVRENLANAARQRGWECQNHDSKDRIENVDEKMDAAPTRHTFILVKDFWRAAKRMKYTFVGVAHDTKKDIADTSVESQSLAGRFCDYYPANYNIEKAPIIFSDLVSCDEYIAWIEAGGNYSAVEKYRSRQLTAQNGRITATPAYSHPSNVKGLEGVAAAEVAARAETEANRMRGVRVPIILRVSAADIQSIPTSHNTQAKIDSILPMLARTHPTLAQELRGFECNEIMKPRERNSTTYKNHITVAVRKATNNQPCAVTIPTEKRLHGRVWNCFIDQFENRLCFIIVGELN